MKNRILSRLTLAVGLLALTTLVFAIPTTAAEVTPQMMKTCHDTVWEQDDFKDIPNAGISIEGGAVKDNGRIAVHWRVDWDNNHARGVCVLKPNGQLFHFQIHANESDFEHGAGAGIYYDTRSRNWKTDDGQVCNTCTAGNGFPTPVVDGPFYFDPETGKWRDSAHRGAVCNTCTPENGFETP